MFDKRFSVNFFIKPKAAVLTQDDHVIKINLTSQPLSMYETSVFMLDVSIDVKIVDYITNSKAIKSGIPP